MKSPLRWVGGKGKLVQKLIPMIPRHRTYVEVFAGGCSLLFAKRTSPIEIINDVDSHIVNFYRVLRDEDMFKEFKELCEKTPFSREEFLKFRAELREDTEKDQVKLAHKWFTVQRQSFSGTGRAFGVNGNSFTRRGMAGVVSSWLYGVDHLVEVHTRLSRCQIEHSDFEYMFRTYDGKDVFFYCDPPYHRETRSKDRAYKFEMTNAQHKSLVKNLLQIQGTAMLSCYDHSIYTPLEEAGWKKKQWGVKVGSGLVRDSERGARIETVYLKEIPTR